MEAFFEHDFSSDSEDEWVLGTELGDLSADEDVLKGEMD